MSHEPTPFTLGVYHARVASLQEAADQKRKAILESINKEQVSKRQKRKAGENQDMFASNTTYGGRQAQQMPIAEQGTILQASAVRNSTNRKRQRQQIPLAQQGAPSPTGGVTNNIDGKARLQTPLKKQTTRIEHLELDDSDNLICSVLANEYENRLQATSSFPRVIPPELKKTCLDNYNTELNAKCTQRPCNICGALFEERSLEPFSKDNTKLDPFRESFDCCEDMRGPVKLCRECAYAIKREQVPKFSIRNHINISLCRKYPSELANLTHVEEAMIARAHPIGIVMKLSKGKGDPSIEYNGTRGHFITFRQDPSPLARILPDPNLKLHQYITVTWESGKTPSDTMLKKWAGCDKNRVGAALAWLKIHNVLYKDVEINNEFLSLLPDEPFVPQELLDNAIETESATSNPREGYAVDLNGHWDNDLDAIYADADPGVTVGGSIFMDQENLGQDSNKPHLGSLVEVVRNLQELREEMVPQLETQEYSASAVNQGNSISNISGKGSKVPHIKYISPLNISPLSAYKDHDFFTAAYPTLFPYGIGGHLGDSSHMRVTRFSLAAWGKWALTHHSRRFAKHRTFLFLLYNVRLNQELNTGNCLQVKKRAWREVQEEIAKVSVQELEAAAEALQKKEKISDKRILNLLKNTQIVSTYNPESFGRKLAARHKIQGLIARFGLASFWFTLNPQDLKDPIVLRIAGVTIRPDITPAQATKLRNAVSVGDPTSVAIFFHSIIETFCSELLRSGKKQMGILGDIINHAGVVEENGRLALHFHGLAWGTGNLDFDKLHVKIVEDEVFKKRMTTFVADIICEKCDEKAAKEWGRKHPDSRRQPELLRPETISQWLDWIDNSSNYIAFNEQLHRHTACCTKYGHTYCRFLFPMPLRWATGVGPDGAICLERNHQWVNRYNKLISCAIRSNHDLKFIPSGAKMLAAMYYITNYATKDDIKQYQVLLHAAMVKKLHEEALSKPYPTAREKTLREAKPENFARDTYNRIRRDVETGSVSVASYLLGYSSFYFAKNHFVNLNLNMVKRYVTSVANRVGNDQDIEDSYLRLVVGQDRACSIYDTYQNRGHRLLSMCLYEYVSQVSLRPISSATKACFRLGANHPQYKTHVQFSITKPEDLATPSIWGSFLRHGLDEEKKQVIMEGTKEVENEIDEVLLGLFVPWQQLPGLFRRFADNHDKFPQPRDACSYIWENIRYQLPAHIQALARQVMYIRKGKEEAERDRKARGLEIQEYRDHNLDLLDSFELSDEAAIAESLVPRWISPSELTSTFGRILLEWDEQLQSQDPSWTTTPFLDSGEALVEQDPVLYERESNENFAHCTVSMVQDWERLLGNEQQKKKTTCSRDLDLPHVNDNEDSIPSNDDNTDDIEADITPKLVFKSNSGASIEQLRVLVEKDLSAENIRDIIDAEFEVQMNEKQSSIINMLISRVLRLFDSKNSYPNNSDQFLLYVGGEGGTGKTALIRCFLFILSLLQRLDTVILGAPTGSAAANINGSTLHTIFGLQQTTGKHKMPSSAKVKKLRQRLLNKSILIIDEISMVGQKMLTQLDSYCTLIYSVDSKSNTILGGIPIVIVLGDFNQFPPVKDNPLWHEEHQIWTKFNNVVILTEPMRQHGDTILQGLLQRAKKCKLTQKDVDLLNSRTRANLLGMGFEEPSLTFTRSNETRSIVNRRKIIQYAQKHNQKIYLFPSQHSQSDILSLDDILRVDDVKGFKGAGLLPYTKGMPCMVLRNICTPAKVVNGLRGTIAGVIYDPNTKMWEVGGPYVLCDRLPNCILVKHQHKHELLLEGLDQHTTPIFPARSYGVLKDCFGQTKSISRKQVPLTSGWCLTDYKSQGLSEDVAEVDIRMTKDKSRGNEHSKWASTNVQLGRVRSLDGGGGGLGLWLTHKITLKDVQFRPDERLQIELERLEKLEIETSERWSLETAGVTQEDPW